MVWKVPTNPNILWICEYFEVLITSKNLFNRYSNVNKNSEGKTLHHKEVTQSFITTMEELRNS